MNNILIIALFFSLFIVSCSKGERKCWSNKENMDEFTVIENPPLIIPPDF